MNGHCINTESALALGQGFMNGEAPAHAVVWFSAEKLKGAGISLCIGALVYVFYIRRRLMVWDQHGNRNYVNRWPTRLDMGDGLYRPLIALLTKAGVAFSAAFAWLGDKAFPKLAETSAMVFSRCAVFFAEGLPRLLRFLPLLLGKVAADLPDAIVSLLGKTILKKIPIPAENPEDREKAELAVPIHMPEREAQIMDSFSYGLLLFALGLCATLVYLLIKQL